MNRKIISLFTLLAFVIFSFSCYTTRLKEVKTAADWKGKKGKIISFVKTSGEYIEFAKDEPGKIYGDKVTGTAITLGKEVKIDRANIERIKRGPKAKILEITTQDGKVYHAVTGTLIKEKDEIIFTSCEGLYKSVSIPLSEVKLIQVKRLSPFKTFLLGFSIAGVIVGAVILGVYISMKDYRMFGY